MPRLPPDRSELRINSLVEWKYPGMTEAVELRARALASKFKSEEDDERVVRALQDQFSLDLRVRAEPTAALQNRKPLAKGERAISRVRRWLREATAYRVTLEGLSEAALIDLHETTFARQKEEQLQKALDRDNGLFFSAKSANADYVKWRSVPVWTRWEAVILSLGKDPSIVTENSISGVPPGSPFRRELRRRLDLVRRGIAAGSLTEPILPSRFLAWAEFSTELSVPDELRTTTKSAQEPQETRVPTSVLKMILGMAMSKYGFDVPYKPEAKPRTFETISNDLNKIGIYVDADTIKKYLLQAIERGGEVGFGKQQGKIWR